MKRRKWTAQEKLRIVLDGLRGDCPISELCNRHQISQGQYYNWRDKLMDEGGRIFEHGGVDRRTERLESENRRLKGIIGDLTVELKKNDW
jgi:transposase-like protein